MVERCSVILRQHKTVEVYPHCFFAYLQLGLIRVSKKNPHLGRLVDGLKAKAVGRELVFRLEDPTKLKPGFIGSQWARLLASAEPVLDGSAITFYRFHNHASLTVPAPFKTGLTDDYWQMIEIHKTTVRCEDGEERNLIDWLRYREQSEKAA